MELKIKIHNPNAIIPSKAGPNEVGYDLTAISFVKKLGLNTFMYDTGISVEPPEGYYTEIVPRSSISKTGFVLSNSVGVIDPTYRGTLKIVLTDVDSKQRRYQGNCHSSQIIGRPLTCPFTLTQLVVRKIEEVDIKIVENLSTTSRGDGSFGSTNIQ